MNRSIANMIQHARLLRHITQGELAEVLGVDASAVAQWESPDGPAPSAEDLKKLSVALMASFQ
jgi:transcriptional regulator with XRE-family HTH domain